MAINAKYRPLVALVALLIAGLLLLEDSPRSLAANGLLNPGFESGTLDGNPLSWPIKPPLADAARVVNAEDFNEFPTYADMGNVTVSPYKGDLMLRLGTPQRLAQNQIKGNNIVTQEYTSNGSDLKLAFRVFSWEHRGRDLVKIDLKQSNASVGDLPAPLQIKNTNGTVVATCTDIPCQFSVDVGSQGQFLDSGWMLMEIVNVPAGNLTLSYQVSGTGDASHATWAYFDNVNTPPVPQYVFAPDDPFEGDIVQFIDESFDPDPGDSIASWSWSIDGVPFGVQSPLFIFPDECPVVPPAPCPVPTPPYVASLTVTDTFGDSATITKQITVQNAVPLVNALNTEAVAGHQTTLIGRFLDTGWEDTHSAVVDLNGITDPSDEEVEEENEPLLSTGLVTATVTPTVSGPVTGNTLTVNDDGAPGGSDSFNLTVLPADTPRDRFEGTTGNNTLATATTLEADASYVNFVPEPGDIDVFKVVQPGGATVEGGGELQVTLHDLHADLDVAILADPPDTATFAASRFAASRFGTSHFAASRFDSSVVAASRFAASRFAASRFAASRFGDFQIGLSTFNESGVGWADLAASRFAASRFAASRFAASRFGTAVTPVDITIEELGLAGVPEGVQLADFSANRLLDPETAVAKSPLDGTEFYVVVFGANGAFTNDPVSLSIEVIEPSNLEADMGAACQGSVLVPDPGTPTTVLHDFGGSGVSADTVVVTQDPRMRAVYGDAAVDEMLANLVSLADAVPGGADILSPASTFYDEWDKHPCSIQEANNTAMAIREEIQTRYPSVKNIVIAGTDKIVPFYRVPDNTVVANERGYFFDSFAKPGTPLFASILQGFVIIDDFYADDSPDAFEAGELWLPDRGIGRLVETPPEIGAQALAGVLSGFKLDVATGFVSGHTFFQDGTNVVADKLDGGLPNPADRMIDDTWDSEDLRCRWLGESSDPSCATTEAPDVSSPNGHSTHYAIESAADFFTGNFDNSVFSSELEVPAGGATVLGGRVVFSMGCHFGNNSPDAGSETGDAALGFDPAADWPQVMAQQGALLWASTGYGIGDDEGIAGTEKLMGIFAEKLLGGGTAGDAGGAAKAEYISGLATVSVYDTKSSMQTVMYGLPMYEIEAAGGMTLQAVPLQEETTPPPNLSITTYDAAAPNQTVPSEHFLAQVNADTGTYYTADPRVPADPRTGDSIATEGRPIQPTLDFNLDERHGFSPSGQAPDPVRGVLLASGTYAELKMSNPVFARPTFEFEQIGGPADICQRSFSPSQVDSLNSFKLSGRVRPTLVLVPGQFQCTDILAVDPNPDDLDGVVRGTELIWKTLNYEVLRCPDTVPADTTPADIGTVEVRSLGPTTIEVRVPASDQSGIKRIVVSKLSTDSFGNGSVTTTQLLLSGLPQAGVFNVTVEDVGSADELRVSVEDGGCNVATESAKSAGINGKRVDAGPDRVVALGTPVTLTATVEEFDPLLPANFFWDFGDGTNASGILAPAALHTVVTINGDCNDIDTPCSATFSVQHMYESLPQTATVRVFDAAGGTGSDDVRILCDAAGDAVSPNGDWVGCASSNNSTHITISVAVDGQVTGDFQYRVNLDAGKYNTKKKRWEQPPDGVGDAQLKYNGGQVTGLSGLTVQVVGNELRFTFPRSAFGLSAGQQVRWYGETQAGVPGQPATGQVDRIPVSGWFSHTVQ